MHKRGPPIYKRTISLVCSFVLLIATMAFTVSAEENSFWVEVLDYGYSQNGTNHFDLRSGSGDKTTFISYVNPLRMKLERIQIIFRTDSTDPKLTTSTNVLTVKEIGDGLYRAYGVHRQDTVAFTLNYTDGTYLDVLSVQVSTVYYDAYVVNASGWIINYHPLNANPEQINISYSGTKVTSTFYVQQGQNTEYQCTLNIPNWQAYDYIDLAFEVNTDSITYVTAFTDDGKTLPVEVSYINLDSNNKMNRVYFTARISVADIVRFSSTSVQFKFGGSALGGSNNVVTTEYVNGLVVPGVSSPFALLIGNLSRWFNDLITAITGTADTSEMENEVDSIKDQMQNASDAMADFTRPNVDEVITNVELDTGAGTPFADMMAAFFENEFIVSIITGSLAFTLFGILVG